MLRVLLGCCLCLLVVAPHSLRGEAAEKALSDAFIRWLRKQVRPVDENIAKRTETGLAREPLRSTKVQEAIRKIHAEPEIRDELSTLWDFMDDATKKRAQFQASELTRYLEEEAERIKKEEKLRGECGEKVASILIKTACFCVKEKSKTGLWPTDELSAKFVMESFWCNDGVRLWPTGTSHLSIG